jgi:hypothetical protein
MNKDELLEKIREKNEELKSLNIELKEILLDEDAKNLGKCFKQNLYSESYIYYKIIQISPEYGRYKVLSVTNNEISIRYWSIIEDSEAYPCSEEEFDAKYDLVTNVALANKVIK